MLSKTEQTESTQDLIHEQLLKRLQKIDEACNVSR